MDSKTEAIVAELFEGQDEKYKKFTLYFGVYHIAKLIHLKRFTDDEVLEEKNRMGGKYIFKLSNDCSGIEYTAYCNEDGGINVFKSLIPFSSNKQIRVSLLSGTNGTAEFKYTADSDEAADQTILFEVASYAIDRLEYDYFCKISSGQEFVEVEFTEKTPEMERLAQDYLGLMASEKVLVCTKHVLEGLYLTMDHYLTNGICPTTNMESTIIIGIGDYNSDEIVLFGCIANTDSFIPYTPKVNKKGKVAKNAYNIVTQLLGEEPKYICIEQVLYDTTNIKFDTLIKCIKHEIGVTLKDVFNYIP